MKDEGAYYLSVNLLTNQANPSLELYLMPEVKATPEEPAPASHPVSSVGITGPMHHQTRSCLMQWMCWHIRSGLCSIETLMHSLQKCIDTDLCDALADYMYVRTQLVASEGLSAFTLCNLIALSKCPEFQPIGVAEVVQQILGETIL